MQAIDFLNTPGHAFHDKDCDLQWMPQRRRNPLAAINRRSIANERVMERAWAICRRDIQNDEALETYVLTLRRQERLANALSIFLPS
jgi:hypothetical protein